MLQSDLVYDLGAHHGDDTAWYLQQGFRVVAVEANPLLAKRIEQQMLVAVASGMLKILNIAITDAAEPAIPFYISRDDWRSSVIQQIAARETSVLETVEVQAHTLGELFAEHGTPHYCKIDIEGADEKAIRGMDPGADMPTYISCELSCQGTGQLEQDNSKLFGTLDALREAGYTQFQLIDQYNMKQLTEANHYSRLRKFYVRLLSKMEMVTGRYTPKYNNRMFLGKQRATNPENVTAPFGDALIGNWYDYNTTRDLIVYHFNDYSAHTSNKELIFWVDIHAKR